MSDQALKEFQAMVNDHAAVITIAKDFNRHISCDTEIGIIRDHGLWYNLQHHTDIFLIHNFSHKNSCDL